jgi:microcystin-dependent protein
MALKKLVTNSLNDDAITGAKLSNDMVGGITPVGGIILWSGSTGSIPSGWALCDGNNGTPDLRNKFIVGAGSTYGVNATGGSADAIVVSHTHGSGTLSAADHTHSFKASNRAGDEDAWSNNNKAFVGDLDNSAFTQSGTNKIFGSGSLSVSGSTASQGSSGTNANLPPYLALAYIMRTA